MSTYYEEHIVNSLNNWLFEESQIVKNLCTYLKIKIKDIFYIKSHKNIPLFENKGKPKTDVFVEVLTHKGVLFTLHISAKKTTRKKSSFHEYSVDDFIKVLDIQEQEIKDILYKHQNDGSGKNFSELEKEKLTLFFNEEKKQILYNWVILGIGGKGEGIQIANCILKNDVFYSIDDYVKTFLNSNSGFGTGFSWTRQSRGKGKTIQLKG